MLPSNILWMAPDQMAFAHSRNHETDLSTKSGNLFKMAAKIESERRIWHTTICDTPLLRSTWRSFDQLQKKIAPKLAFLCREQERMSYLILSWCEPTEALSDMGFCAVARATLYSINTALNSPIDDAPSKTESGRPV